MKQLKYFISYTSKTENDVAWAKWVEWVIRVKLNGKTEMMEYDFLPGDNFRLKMDRALKRANKVVCILTRNYLKSSNCAEEWSNAFVKIIPIKFDNCKPRGLLTSKVYINLFGLDRDSARDMLITKMRGVKRPADEPDALFASAGVRAGVGASAMATALVDEPYFPVDGVVDIGGSAVGGDSGRAGGRKGENTKSIVVGSAGVGTDGSVVDCGAVHNLPQRNNYFTGREDALGKIGDGLQLKNVVTLIGAGGFGKTQIALGYAYRHLPDYKLIWYFNADSEARLQDDYRKFARRNLGIENAI